MAIEPNGGDELKKLEGELRRSERRFATMFRAAHAGVIVVRVSTWSILEVNDAFLEMFGWTREEVLGRTTADLGLYAPGVREQVFANLDANGEVRMEIRAGGRSGEERICLLSVARFDLDGDECAIGLYYDVTDLRRADAALLESSRELSAMFALVPVGIAQADPQTGRFVRVNDAMCEITGYTEEELRGKPIADITHPDDVEMTRAFFERAKREVGTPRSIEKRYVRKDGRTIWVRVQTAVLQDAAGRAVRMIATIEEVTERHAADETLKLLTTALEAAANAIVITDRAGLVRWVNPAFTRVTGYEEHEVVGRTPGMLRSGKQDKAFYEEMWRAILAGRVWHGELVNRRKDGSLYDEHMMITPVRDAHGTISHFIAIKQDVTQQKRTEDQLRAAQKMEAVGRLAGGVAHDFNNLLTVIRSYTELALMDLPADAPGRADLGEVVEAAKRAEGLTRQLLAFSRKQVLETEALDLNELVETLGKMLRRLIGEDVELRVLPGPRLQRIKADRGQLEQVLMNVLINARDAMPDGGKVTLTTRDVTLSGCAAAGVEVPEGDYVELSVADTGTGMDEATRARIFEPFFTTKEVGKGTGLGMAMVYGIVRQSGGGIVVESAPGKGTTLRIWLPKHVLPSQADAAPASQPRRATPTTTTGRETILTVEDEESVRKVLARILGGAGYTVLLATSPAHALRLAEERGAAVDLILTDVVMPDMSGPQLVIQLAPLCPSAKVIYMSGYTDDKIAHHDLSRLELIRKPFDQRALTERIRAVIDRA